jgi:hypothetical protein
VIITDPVVLIRPARLYRTDMPPDELLEATQGVWRLNPARASKARFVLAVVRGTVVEAYQVDGWQPAGTAQYHYRPRHEIERAGRYEFVGRRADEAGQRYVGTSVDEHIVKGNQNPIRYVNC